MSHAISVTNFLNACRLRSALMYEMAALRSLPKLDISRLRAGENGADESTASIWYRTSLSFDYAMMSGICPYPMRKLISASFASSIRRQLCTASHM